MASQLSKSSRKTIKQIFQIEAKQFCLNTALHGYKFIVLPRRTLLERVIWGAICLASLVIALTLLCMAWFSFQENPTALVTDSTNYPIWEYDFPAVTICDYNILSKKRTYELARNLSIKNNETTENLIWDLRLLFQLVSHNDLNIPEKNYTRVDELLKANSLSVNSALQKMSPTCNNILVRCKWKGENKRCASMFETIRSSDGFCCSFNYFALKNHTFDGLMANKAPKRPRRVSACGHQTALEVLVDIDPKDYFATYIPSVGFRVLIHNSYVFPDWTLQNILLQTKTLNLVSVSPTLTYSTDNIKSMPIHTRQCLFPHERALLNFGRYNFHNCMVECRMNLTLKLCGCKPFYYTNGKGDDRNVCSFRNLPCLAANEALITSSVPGLNFTNSMRNKGYSLEDSVCDCLPDCETIDYLSEYASGDLNIKYISQQTVTFAGLDVKNQSLVKVFFNDLVAIRNRRDVIFTWHTLLAYYGGILGLFTGFSFVSGMEIIYFFLIRVLTNILKNNNYVQESNKISVQDKGELKIQPRTFQTLDPKHLLLTTNIGVRNRNSHPYYE